MQFHEEVAGANQRIANYGKGFFVINEARHTSSVLLSAHAGCLPWSATELDTQACAPEQALATVLHWSPAIILLGTGATHQFAPPAWVAEAARGGAALEAMNSGAACRTFNVLAAEGRAVAAMLLLIA